MHCIYMTDGQCSPHISTKHNRRDQRGLIMIKHPVTKKLCKGRATDCINSEGYQRKIIFHTFKYIFYNCVSIIY